MKTAKLICLLLATTVLSFAQSGFLGVNLEKIDEKQGLSYDGEGVYISGVVDESAAAKAGLVKGNVLVAINGETVNSPKEVVHALSAFEPNDEVGLKVWRNGQIEDMTVALGERAGGFGLYPHKMIEVLNEKGAYAGFRMMNLNDQLARYFKVNSGVLVEEVVEESPAERGGLQAGDVVTMWGDRKIEDAGDLHKAIRKSTPDEAVNVTVIRSGETVTLSVIPEEREGFQFGGERFHFSPNFRFEKGDFNKQLHESLGDLNQFKYEFRDELNGEWRDELKEQMEDLKEQMKELKETLKMEKEKKIQ